LLGSANSGWPLILQFENTSPVFIFTITFIVFAQSVRRVFSIRIRNGLFWAKTLDIVFSKAKSGVSTGNFASFGTSNTISSVLYTTLASPVCVYDPLPESLHMNSQPNLRKLNRSVLSAFRNWRATLTRIF
jgi:hypothetical protein